ncbi:hypothetical protein LJC20_00465 [Eubacteriales bacterium OttesenSCG-928-M02]|nr:hypothetical protein [Eubacteriales bacterium OttesenSCG-928-M02]
MKLKCVKNVQDKYTGENYKAGKTYEFEKEDRYNEVLASQYFEAVEDDAKAKAKAEAEAKAKAEAEAKAKAEAEANESK